MPPMKRVVAAAQRRTHSGASDSDQRKGRGGAGCDSDSHSVKGHPIRFLTWKGKLANLEGRRESSLQVWLSKLLRQTAPNCQTAKLPN